MIKGSQQLPIHHITVRVPWHDAGWDGTICRNPCANTSCMVLPRIGTGRDDTKEKEAAGRSVEKMATEDLPPCVDEHGTFMAKFGVHQLKNHPYKKVAEKTHGHFEPTPYSIEPYSAAAIPFRWMLKENVEGNARRGVDSLAAKLALDYDAAREPEMPEHVPDTWVQEGKNQRVLLDTFFSAVQPEESLVFFYAKRTPLADDPRRVIVGVGRVKGVGAPLEYAYAKDRPRGAMTGFLWERAVSHSIRVDGKGERDGFLLPYQELLQLTEEDPGLELERCVAFAPDEAFEQYSYGSELLSQDNAISSLLAVERALREIKELIPGPWEEHRAWVDRELNRLWKLRGAFPGFGAALSAFGIPNGNLLAWHLASDMDAEDEHDPWVKFESVLKDPGKLPRHLAGAVGPNTLKKWNALQPNRRALLKLLSRFELSNDLAALWFTPEARAREGVRANDAEILANPYLLSEHRGLLAVPFGTIDRGLLAAPNIRDKAPVPEPSKVSEVIDSRRVRALIVDRLEAAALDEGHTLLPEPWLIERVRALELSPICPLDADVMPIFDDELGSVVELILGEDGSRYYQLSRYVDIRRCIADLVRKRRRAVPHASDHDWAGLVDAAIGDKTPRDEWDASEAEARAEKTAALKMIFESRISVLLGAAGTGKSTLIKALCNVQGILENGVLLLAPTGKARVRLEQTSGMAGRGQTIAQFLNKYGRYDGSTGTYFMNPSAAKSAGARTVVIDECSMLTEDQLAATLDALEGVDRLILIGDPKQLPPIGAGRPFVDVVNLLRPDNSESLRPRVAPNYAELLVTRRQKGDEDRLDLEFANLFSGEEQAPGRDEVWGKLRTAKSEHIQVINWTSPEQLERALNAALVEQLGLNSDDDELGFALSYGAAEHGGRAYFWPKKGDGQGAAEKVEAWQVLSPLRSTPVGTDAVNRGLQSRFRAGTLKWSAASGYNRHIPRPLGPHRLLWGDKVINVKNSGRRKTWPEAENAYVANGEIGVATGFFKTKGKKSVIELLEVEMASQPGRVFKYWPSEFGADASPPLELAFALTVHKTQGSEFGITFLVLPNPCRILSRELLYTALTRQQEKVVLLIQGELRELHPFTLDTASEIKRRMTNLFELSRPTEIVVGNRKVLLDERLIYKTDRGELVRSKSEWIIADKLNAAGISYLYEQPIMLDGTERWPDFTIHDDDSGVTWYWEHLGRMDLPKYRKKWDVKKEAFAKEGIVPYKDFKPGQSKGILVTTIEDGLRDDLSQQIGSTVRLIQGEDA